MRRPVLAALVAALSLVPVLALRGQSTQDQPHGDLQLDCAECHNPERWVPVDKPPTFRHDKTGFVLESAHAKAACRELPPHARVQPGGNGLRRLPQGRAPRRDGLPVRVLPHAHHLDEPERDVPRPRPHALPALRLALPARLHRLPPQPEPVPVQEHARGVRKLPPLDLPRDHEPQPRPGGLLETLRGLPPRRPPRRGTARPSRTRRPSPSREVTPPSPARAATTGGRTRGSRARASPATRRTTPRRPTRTTPPGASRPPARTATRSPAGDPRSSTTARPGSS